MTIKFAKVHLGRIIRDINITLKQPLFPDASKN